MKTTFVKLLIGYRGRVVSIAVGTVVGVITKALADRNLTLDPEIEQLIVGGVGFGAMWIIDTIVIKLQADGVKEIQDALPAHVDSDGVPGDVTVAAVKRAVSDQQ